MIDERREKRREGREQREQREERREDRMIMINPTRRIPKNF